MGEGGIMESLYVNPIVEDIDSAGKAWAALADDSAGTVKNLTSVANVLDKIAKNTQTTKNKKSFFILLHDKIY